ncbi:MAG: hypothetical protein ABH863_03185 [Candidatus Micrarchaeota archaeon]
MDLPELIKRDIRGMTPRELVSHIEQIETAYYNQVPPISDRRPKFRESLKNPIYLRHGKHLTPEQEVLYITHYDTAMVTAQRFARRFMLSFQDGEEIASSALYDAAGAMDKSKGEFPALLHRTIKNRILDAARKTIGKKHVEFIEDGNPAPKSTPSHEGKVRAKIKSDAAIRRLLELYNTRRVGKRDVLALMLTVHADMSKKDAGGVLHWSEESVRTAREKAISALKTSLKFRPNGT